MITGQEGKRKLGAVGLLSEYVNGDCPHMWTCPKYTTQTSTRVSQLLVGVVRELQTSLQVEDKFTSSLPPVLVHMAIAVLLLLIQSNTL